MNPENNVSLAEMLSARENRAQRQLILLQRYQKPLISLSMNIAGPIKTNAMIERAFLHGLSVLRGQLYASGHHILKEEVKLSKTGNEALLVVEGQLGEIKTLCAEIEDFDLLGRLFDIDVLDCTQQKIERESLGQTQRACLLCEKPAKECARNRSHSVESLWEKTQSILKKHFAKQDANTLAYQAERALLFEVCTSPKPGLVDRYNNGSHRDMDLFLFMNSSASLREYFLACAKLGQEALSPTACFARMQILGRRAEANMFSVTRGVNTHKGAIFSMGIVCTAAARVGYQNWRNRDAILLEASKMVEGLCAKSFDGLNPKSAKTAGERLYLQYGLKGARGQAETGFPAVKLGLEILEKGLALGLSLNDAATATLLHILANECDSNMIHRGSWKIYQEEKEKLLAFLAKNPYPTMEEIAQLDKDYIAKNLSPGGSADLLALCFFLHFLSQNNNSI